MVKLAITPGIDPSERLLLRDWLDSLSDPGPIRVLFTYLHCSQLYFYLSKRIPKSTKKMNIENREAGLQKAILTHTWIDSPDHPLSIDVYFRVAPACQYSSPPVII
jgi:hypothetical protein